MRAFSFFRRTPPPPTPVVVPDWDAADAFWGSQGKSQLR